MLGNSEGSGAKSYMTNDLLINGENSCAFPHILGSPSSFMTLHPIPFEFPYMWGQFCCIFYQCCHAITHSWAVPAKKGGTCRPSKLTSRYNSHLPPSPPSKLGMSRLRPALYSLRPHWYDWGGGANESQWNKNTPKNANPIQFSGCLEFILKRISWTIEFHSTCEFII